MKFKFNLKKNIMKDNNSTNCSKKSCCNKNANNKCCCNKEASKNKEEIRKEVSEVYSKYAKEEPQCKCKSKKYAISLGYTEEDLSDENTIVGNLSCGNLLV